MAYVLRPSIWVLLSTKCNTPLLQNLVVITSKSNDKIVSKHLIKAITLIQKNIFLMAEGESGAISKKKRSEVII